jgi:hypothetical protein
MWRNTGNAFPDQIDSIIYIAKVPQIDLTKFDIKMPIQLSSAVPLNPANESEDISKLQSIVIIDSGINSNHNRLNRYIDGTFDFLYNKPGPCLDNTGHGSGVAGLAIYGGDLRNNLVPSAKVIMVKNFDITGIINQDIISIIRKTIQEYRFTSRVMNLSFNASSPNLSLTKALDEIAFLSDYLVVVSAGNIKEEDISAFLDLGIGYPNYIHRNVVYFPADCRNVVTVGGHTEHPSNFVAKDCPSPFTKSGFALERLKPETMAPGGNYECQLINGANTVLPIQGLGIISASNTGNQQVEGWGTSFSSPIVANAAAQIIEQRVDFSPFLVKALLISSCRSMSNTNHGGKFSQLIQGFGKLDKIFAIYSLEWRVCFLLQGEFDSNSPNMVHHYTFFFPDQADRLEITSVCGKQRTGHSQENNEYILLKFKRPGVPTKTPMKRGILVGAKKCCCANKKTIKIERANRGEWGVDVYPHFCKLQFNQKIKYGIVIAVSSSKGNDVSILLLQS